VGTGLLTAYGKMPCSLSCQWCGKLLHMGIKNAVFCKNMQYMPHWFPFVKFVTVFRNSLFLLHWMDSVQRFMMTLLIILPLLLLIIIILIIPTITKLYPSVKIIFAVCTRML
jgi:hypothetical protein